MDYASLYPSSIIEKNISHETFIDIKQIEENGWIENKDYQKITYDNWIYKGKGEGDTIEKILDEENPKVVCYFLTKDFMTRNDAIDWRCGYGYYSRCSFGSFRCDKNLLSH